VCSLSLKSITISVTLLPVLLLSGAAFADSDLGDVPIVVSPNVLNLQSDGVWVTVHAEIRYSLVEGITVTLNGLPVEVTKSDARGELVAKFSLDAVKGILDVGAVELTLVGETWDGETFTGTDLIEVIDKADRR
jgi:hypothetical protein